MVSSIPRVIRSVSSSLEMAPRGDWSRHSGGVFHRRSPTSISMQLSHRFADCRRQIELGSTRTTRNPLCTPPARCDVTTCGAALSSYRIKGFLGAKPPRKLRWTNAGSRNGRTAREISLSGTSADGRTVAPSVRFATRDERVEAAGRVFSATGGVIGGERRRVEGAGGVACQGMACTRRRVWHVVGGSSRVFTVPRPGAARGCG